MSKRILAAVPVYHAVDPRPFIHFLLTSQHTGMVEAQGGPVVRWSVYGPKSDILIARNQACGVAMNGGADFLAFVDDDMLIHPVDIFHRLAAHNVDIVAPLFFRSDGDNAPLLFDLADDGRPMPVFDYPQNTLYRVSYGVGTGVMMVKREVLEKIGSPWFYRPEGSSTSFDLYFCKRAIDLGFKVYCDTSIKVKQMGNAKPVGEEDFSHQRSLDRPSVN
jgi:glycosyltransferase involved in cell wall biosynthesis